MPSSSRRMPFWSLPPMRTACMATENPVLFTASRILFSSPPVPVVNACDPILYATLVGAVRGGALRTRSAWSDCFESSRVAVRFVAPLWCAPAQRLRLLGAASNVFVHEASVRDVWGACRSGGQRPSARMTAPRGSRPAHRQSGGAPRWRRWTPAQPAAPHSARRRRSAPRRPSCCRRRRGIGSRRRPTRRVLARAQLHRAWAERRWPRTSRRRPRWRRGAAGLLAAPAPHRPPPLADPLAMPPAWL